MASGTIAAQRLRLAKAQRSARNAVARSLSPVQRAEVLANELDAKARQTKLTADYRAAIDAWATVDSMKRSAGPPAQQPVRVVVEESGDAERTADPAEPAADARQPRVH